MSSPAYRRLFIFVMFLVCVFNFADRAVFAVLAQSIKTDLKLTDLRIGLLQGLSFAFLYALCGIPIGRLAERVNRVKIVAAATAIWSAMTVACGFAPGFTQLMLARIGVGLGEAGFLPPVSSLVSDHYPAERRSSAMSLILLGTPVGLFAGSLFAAWVASSWHWRTAFWVIGAPGLIVAALVLWKLREPPRGFADGTIHATRTPPKFRQFLTAVIGKRALALVVVGGGLAGFGMSSVAQFLAIFLARVHGMPVREAGFFYGCISALSLAIGLMAGSFGTERLAKKDSRWPAWGSAIGLAVAPLIYFAAFAAADRVLATVLLVMAGASLLVFYGPTLGMIQNMLEPRMRASGSALFTMLYTLIGTGLGPPLVGFMSDRFAERAFAAGNFVSHCPGGIAPVGAAETLRTACAAASASGLRHALYLAVSVLFLSSICYLFAARTLRIDLFKPEPA